MHAELHWKLLWCADGSGAYYDVAGQSRLSCAEACLRSWSPYGAPNQHTHTGDLNAIQTATFHSTSGGSGKPFGCSASEAQMMWEVWQLLFLTCVALCYPARPLSLSVGALMQGSQEGDTYPVFNPMNCAGTSAITLVSVQQLLCTHRAGTGGVVLLWRGRHHLW